MNNNFYRGIALGIAAVLPLTALSIASPGKADVFGDIFSDRYRHGQSVEEFEECAMQLLEAGVGEVQTAIACAEALEPTDLSQCVSAIDTNTTIPELYALYACFRVRLPLELSECVVEINTNVLASRVELAGGIIVSEEEIPPLALATLDHCRRSLLPKRFSSCVVGLSRQIILSPPQALRNCIEAEDFPRQLYTPATNATLEPEVLPDVPPTETPSEEIPPFELTPFDEEVEITPLDEDFELTP